MKAEEIIQTLKSLGSESTKKVLMKHGAKEPFYGVKIEALKKIQKKIPKDYALSMALYDSGISDAMYLAGLIADPSKMSKQDLQKWADQAYWYMLSEYTVPWVTSESAFALELALEWIDSAEETIAAAGWSTLGSYVSITPDEQLDQKLWKKLLERAEKNIHAADNRVRYTMNGFVIALGSYVPGLTNDAIQTGKKIGPVAVDMGGTACKVPLAADYIEKVQQKGNIGKKRKTAKC